MIATLLACRAAAAAEESRSLRFVFSLDNEYATSAGAFDSDGTLVRTLWSNRRLGPGVHDASWDGRDDDGRPVSAAAEYEVRVLKHNVVYRWDGVIGNSSSDFTSPVHHAGQYFFNDLVVSGDRAYFTAPVEGPTPSMRYFKLDAPQYWHALPALSSTYGATMGLIAADDERVYWAHDSSPWQHTWGKGGDQAFVIATDRDISREIVFEAGSPVCVRLEGSRCYRDAQIDESFRSAIDIVREVPENAATPVHESSRNDVTGLAVQRTGPLLFVAHGGLAEPRIHVFDKRSGRPLARIPLAGVGRLACGPGLDDLWAIHEDKGARVVSRLRVHGGPDFALSTVLTLQGLEAPIALALTPDGKSIIVADGSSSQQLKAFDVATGALLWKAGQEGGYAKHGPVVSAQKFSFHRDEVNSLTGVRHEQTVLAVQPDGAFWVGDTGLSRVLEFSPDREYRDQIQFLPINYNVAVDRNDPSRVFSRYLEYAVDYSKPIDRGWQLVRYFGDGASIGYRAFDAGFIDVSTLRNGRTYGLLRSRQGIETVEIPAEGDLKHLPLRLKTPVFMNKGGDLYSQRASMSAGRIEIWRRRLAGFDEDDSAPQWGREEPIARVTRAARDPRANPYGGTAFERGIAQLDSDLHVVFDPANSGGDEFHLAGVREGASRWLWRASPSSGRFDLAQPDGVFDNSKPWYAGMAVSGIGSQIVYNYHGEGWHNEGQVNQFLHWYRDGLFVGQFGVPRLRGIAPGAAGVAGNSLSIQLVEAGGATYLWHNDENEHYGLHRWHLDGVEWIRELTGRGRLDQRIELKLAPPTRNEPAHEPSAREQLAHEHAAPSALTAQASPGRVRLSWKNTVSDAAAVEVQRVVPTYVGPRFERLTLLAPNADSYVDAQPLAGEPTVYRVRAVYSDGASEYSNHVHLTAPSNERVLESQRFEAPPPALRDDFHLQGMPDVEVGIVADPVTPSNHVLRVRARKGSGPRAVESRVRWAASPALFRALNESLGKPRGSTPDIYRVQLRLRVLQAQLGASSDASLQIDPGYDLFSTEGRRHRLTDLAGAKTEWVNASFNVAAIPNGAGSGGLQQYESTAPTDIAVVFPIALRSDGDVIEFLVDDFSVSRL